MGDQVPLGNYPTTTLLPSGKMLIPEIPIYKQGKTEYPKLQSGLQWRYFVVKYMDCTLTGSRLRFQKSSCTEESYPPATLSHIRSPAG